MSIDTSHQPGPAAPGPLQDYAHDQWVELLGRIRFASLPPHRRRYLNPLAVHAVGDRLACYACPDGGRIVADTARLAVELEISYELAEAALQVLVGLGLLRLVSCGGRPGRADEYHLAAPPDGFGDVVQVWPPERYTAEVARMGEAAAARG